MGIVNAYEQRVGFNAMLVDIYAGSGGHHEAHVAAYALDALLSPLGVHFYGGSLQPSARWLSMYNPIQMESTCGEAILGTGGLHLIGAFCLIEKMNDVYLQEIK